MKKILFFLISTVAISCNEKNVVVVPNATRILLTVQNLTPLEEGHYQLWAKFLQFNKPSGADSPLHDDGYESLGEFNVRPQDQAIIGIDGGEPQFELPAGRDPQLIIDVAIAVQSHEARPAKIQHDEIGSILLAGSCRGDATKAVADLSVLHEDAFRSSFLSAIGKCTIVCPTSPSDSNSGVWFVEAGSPLIAGLRNLPLLPAGWRYEGWVAHPIVTVHTDKVGYAYWSTGKFSRADSADFDGAGPNRGSDSTRTGFNFPGQDFVRGSTVIPSLLTGGFWFMITLEPFPDNASEPFFLRVLSTPTTQLPPTGRTLTMQNVVVNSTPTGTVVLLR